MVITIQNIYESKDATSNQWRRFLIYGLTPAIIIILGCCTDPNTNDVLVDLSTTRSHYLSSDTISIWIDNDSGDSFNFGLRCGGYLEMFYQQKVDGEWSEDQWFFYMSYLCPTLVDSVQTGEYFEYRLPAAWFEELGTFRLSLGELYSNQFKIE